MAGPAGSSRILERRAADARRIASLRAYATAAQAHDAVLDVRVGADSGHRLPGIGLHAVSPSPVTAADKAHLQRLGLDHVRVDLDVGEGAGLGWLAERAVDAAALAAGIGAELELALRWSVRPGPGLLRRAASALPRTGLARVLVTGTMSAMAGAADLREVRDALRDQGLRVPVVAAAGDHYVTLNRGWRHVGPADGLAFPVQSGVHADDDLSCIESLEGQRAAVASARAHRPDLPVSVSSIILGAGGPTDDPDPRQSDWFGACWLIGSVSALAAAGATSLTYGGWVGRSGLPSQGIAVEASVPTPLLPTYHVLRELASVRHGRVRATEVTGTFPGLALAVRDDSQLVVFVANMAPRSTMATVAGLDGGAVSMRTLNAEPAVERTGATSGPRPPRDPGTAAAAAVSLGLAPFGVAVVSQALQ